ncbi:hypothetical protein M409DRAFT_51054 [Zasmidium cellare ATCC 36951]|uniref:Uncharacterized protein n=1 Tax=Zasmidium cellare ATCC 36951 TaxID=1080233 RepID=A0A6A6CX46_ZASCE|nr:uncharacterized protein M409DRAFT_51054 [Zasmidium cellare ATCC 36951]KAF2170798.1 hypothetical protein M409DRAFT_51054 [Zasmidium cellare ATCC 36951]
MTAERVPDLLVQPSSFQHQAWTLKGSTNVWSLVRCIRRSWTKTSDARLHLACFLQDISVQPADGLVADVPPLQFVSLQNVVKDYVSLKLALKCSKLFHIHCIAMKNQCFIAAVAAFASSTVLAASNVCTKDDYSSLSCLQGNDAAASECSSRVPAYTTTRTLTDASTTLFTISTTTTTSSTTRTTFVSTTPAAKKTGATARRLKARATTCATSEALESLSSMGDDEIATACSCIGDQAATNTATTTITTQTAVESFTQTLSTTRTATITLAAPSYTHVWGPQEGCQDTTDRDTLQLSSDVTEKSDARQLCQDWCSQKSVCTGLYVQYMFPAYGVTPFWQCYANDHKFDADTDLLCNLTTNIWGEADAYNALGRGQPAS